MVAQSSSRSSPYRRHASSSSAHALQPDEPNDSNHDEPNPGEPEDTDVDASNADIRRGRFDSGEPDREAQDLSPHLLAHPDPSSSTTALSKRPPRLKPAKPRYQIPPTSPRGLWKAFKRKMDLSRFASQPHFRDEKRHTRDMMDHPLRRRRSGKLYGEGTADRPVENPTLDYEAIQKAKNDAKRAQMIPAAYTPDPNDPSSRRPLTRAQRMTTRPALQSSQSDRKAVIADRKRNNMLRSLGINPALYEEVAAGKPISLQTINLLKSQSVAFPGTEPVSVIDGVSEPATSPLTDVKLPKPAPFDAHSPYHRSRKRDPFRVLIDQQAFRLLRKGTRVSAADARRLKLRLSKMSLLTRQRLADIGELTFGQNGRYTRKRSKRKRSRIRTDRLEGSTVAASFYKRQIDRSRAQGKDVSLEPRLRRKSIKLQPRNRYSPRRLRKSNLLVMRRPLLSSTPAWKRRRKLRVIIRRPKRSTHSERRIPPMRLSQSKSRSRTLNRQSTPKMPELAPLRERSPSWPSSKSLRNGRSLPLEDTKLGKLRPKEAVPAQAVQLLARRQAPEVTERRVRSGRCGWQTVTVQEWEQRAQAKAGMLAETRRVLLDFSRPSKVERVAEGYVPVPLNAADLIGLGSILEYPRMVTLEAARLRIFPNVSDLPQVFEMLKDPNPPLVLDNSRGQDGQRPACAKVTREHQDILNRSLSAGTLAFELDSAPYSSLMFASLHTLGLLVFRFQLGKTRPEDWLWLATKTTTMLQEARTYKETDLEPSLMPTAYATLAFCLAQAVYGDPYPDRSEPILELARAALGFSSQSREALPPDGESPTDDLPSESSKAPETSATAGDTFGPAQEAALRSITAAHLGDWDVARRCMTQALFINLSANSDKYPKADLHLLLQYRQLLESANRSHDLVDVILTIPSLINPPLLGENDADPHMPLFCEVFYSALAGIRRPSEWFSATIGWSDETKKTAALLFTVLTRYQSRSSEALAVCERLYTSGLYIPLDASARLCGTLVRLKQFDEALTLYRFTRERNRNISHLFLSNSMNAFVQADLLDKADEIYQEISQMYSPKWQDRAAIPIRLSQLGRPKETLQVLRANFGPKWAEDVGVMRIMHRAYISANDPDGAERMLQRMLDLSPDDIASYNAVIKLYADRGDVSQAIGKFHSLLDAELAPTVQTFRIIIRMFANKSDLPNVALLLETMARCGIDPDAHVSAAVIKAHINCGEWQGAARVYDSLPEDIRGSPQVSSAILRAYVMLSVPPTEVLSAFSKIPRPTASHWSMLILSYCDAGRMKEAARAFKRMDQRSRENPDDPVPDLYTFSIFIYGCLRNNDGNSAQEAFHEMIRRGIVPTSVTYGTIIQSYLSIGRPLDSKRLQTVHTFAMSVYTLAKQDGLADPAGSQVDSVSNLFRGMIRAAGEIGDADAAQAYHDVASKRPGGPDLQMVNQLMVAYRKKGDVEMVMQLWRQAVSMAQDLRGPADSPTRTTNGENGVNRLRVDISRPSNLLCVSLSITMETLGNAGAYGLLRDTWNQVRMEGFGFDPNNFNTYAIALVRTGDVEGAFYVFDKVLMPRWRAAMERRRRALRREEDVSTEAVGKAVRVVQTSSDEESASPIAETPQATASDSEVSEASDLADDVDSPDLKSARSMLPPQKMSALLYNKYQSDQDPSYDPAVWGGATDFAKENAPAASATIPPPGQFGSLQVSRGATGRSQAMYDPYRSEVPIVDSDTPFRILSKYDTIDPLWRPSWELLEILSSAYAEIQRQRKVLSDQVEEARQQISEEYEAAKETMGTQVPGRFDMGATLPDEKDPRRQPRIMELPQFNRSPVRDRYGMPMRSTPVVVLWRLNAIYPGVVKQIYRYRRTAGMATVSDEVSDANIRVAKAKKTDDAFIALTAKRMSAGRPQFQDGASSLAELETEFASRRERMRQYLLSRVHVPQVLDREWTSESFALPPNRIDGKRKDGLPEGGRELLDEVYSARASVKRDKEEDIERMPWKERRADRSLQDPGLRSTPIERNKSGSKPRAREPRTPAPEPCPSQANKARNIKTLPGFMSPDVLGQPRTSVSKSSASKQSWMERLAPSPNDLSPARGKSEGSESMVDFANNLVERERRVERRSIFRLRDKMVDADARMAMTEVTAGEESPDRGMTKDVDVVPAVEEKIRSRG